MRPSVTVCGLGPGGRGGLTEATVEALSGSDRVFLRTARHPTADRAVGAESFDGVYEHAVSFDEVYRVITAQLAAAARADGHVIYAVPGSPLVLERSVRYLLADRGLDVAALPAVSFLDEVWARLGVDPVDDGVRLVDGHRFATEAADQRGPLLVAHAHAPWVLSAIKLALDAGPEQRVIVLQRLGTDEEAVFELPWPELDRSFEPDHLTSLYLPELAAPVGRELARSVEMMHRLRNECPWDRTQTHHTLRTHLIEEAYEVLEAIEAVSAGGEAEAYAHLEEELGDLLFQILFHAELAGEEGWFTMADVAAGLVDKMIGRHPHVYGDHGVDAVPTEASRPENWERLKREEKGRASALDGIPSALPALARAEKVLRKGGAVTTGPIELGEPGQALASVVPEGTSEGEVGRVLLTLVELAKRQGINAEQALRLATGEAVDRFRAAEGRGPVDGRWVIG